MRTSDPAAYDDFTPLTNGVAQNSKFRGLMVTSPSSVLVTFTITFTRVNNLGVASTTTKVLAVNVSSSQTVIIPMSGDAVTAAFSAGNVYALI